MNFLIEQDFILLLTCMKLLKSKYLEMDVDKDKFCEMYKNNDGDLAECIQMETDKAAVIKLNEITKKAKEEKEALECKIRMLEKGMKDLQLLYDKELEWKPYEMRSYTARKSMISL